MTCRTGKKYEKNSEDVGKKDYVRIDEAPRLSLKGCSIDNPWNKPLFFSKMLLYIKLQFVHHRKHIASPLRRPTG
jgi:hypothetical protein